MIPLCIPNLGGNEWKYIKDCLDTNWVSSAGSYVNRFEQEFAAYVGAPFAVSMSSGTSALHIALILTGIERNDLIIVPNITFAATLNSIVYTGAEPLLIDVDADTWQMDTALLETFLKEQTEIRQLNCYHKQTRQRIKAIMPVHVLGNMVNMEHLLRLAATYHLTIIEDSTEALGSYYSGQHAGTFGKVGCFSFNGNKIMTTGGGGMLVTSDPGLAKRAKHISTQAKTDPVEYIHDETGYNYRLVNLLAAMGLAQLEQMPVFIARKKEIANLYNQAFKSSPEIISQSVTKNTVPNNWLYTIKVPDRRKLLDYLKTQNIETRPLWTPMNRLVMFAKNLYITTEDISGQLFEQCLSLPCSTNLSKDDQDKVIVQVLNFFSFY